MDPCPNCGRFHAGICEPARQPDIVKVIKKCDCWSRVMRERDGSYEVRVYFEDKAAADEFAVELMMVTAGQKGYEESDKP